jgi:hypothetical protein
MPADFCASWMTTHGCVLSFNPLQTITKHHYQPKENQAGVIEGLKASGRQESSAMAALAEKAMKNSCDSVSKK